MPADTWKLVQLRLSDFPGADLKNINGVCFVFHGTGTVYLEDLKFVDEPNQGEFDPTFIELSGRSADGASVIEAVSARPHEANGLVARIQVPYEDSRVRGNVPVFGLACGKNFKEYRVEYGYGKNPDKWTVIYSSAMPQDEKVPSAERKFGEGKTVHGNLAT